MANFNTLPYEIQQLILQHIDSRRQLGECRRVSKIWDVPAECAMFSRQLRLTQKIIRPLYEHLCRKPVRGNLIKQISFDQSFAYREFPEFTIPLLQMAITPSIEKIDTFDYSFEVDIRFYQTLTQIVRDSGMRLERLKSIPWPHQYTDTHYQTALLLKDFLAELKITFDSAFFGPHKISKHLDEFKNLKKLEVNGCTFGSLPQVESIFRGAGNLMEIVLIGCCFDGENVWPDEERLQWMRQHVEINENAIILTASDNRSKCTSLIEYFLFKYSNIRQFVYDSHPIDDLNLDVEISSQACSLISKTPSYVMDLSWEHRWRTHYRSFAGYKNEFRLYYGEDAYEREYPRISSIVEEQDKKRTTQFQLVFEEGFFDTHATFLQDISTFATHLQMDLISLDLQDGLASMTDSRVLFEALEVMNHLEEMKFIASENSLVSVQLDFPPQYIKRQFNTLEIIHAQIQPEMFNTLNRFFHTITTLKLSCCLIKKDSTSNTVSIHMPSTSLGELIMTTKLEPTIPLVYRPDVENMNLLTHDTYLIINLQQGVTLYFKLQPFNNNARQVSSIDFTSSPEYAHAFKIDCQLLGSIELDLGDIRATIDVQKYYDTLNVAAIDESKV